MPVQGAEQQALLVTFPFNDTDLSSVFVLEDLLIATIEKAEAGEFDGNEVGGGSCTLYMYGPSADRLFDVVFPILVERDLPAGSHVMKRFGGPGARAERIDLSPKHA